MERIGAYQAKSRLHELIEEAEQGKDVTITRRGKPVARLVPVRARATEAGLAAAIREILEFGKTIKAKPFNLRKAIESGRR